MRRKNTEPLADVIRQYLKVVGADKRLKEIRLKREWENIIGRTIAKRTHILDIKKGVCYLKVNSSVIKHELSMIKSDLIFKLNENAGEQIIFDIKFI